MNRRHAKAAGEGMVIDCLKGGAAGCCTSNWNRPDPDGVSKLPEGAGRGMHPWEAGSPALRTRLRRFLAIFGLQPSRPPKDTRGILPQPHPAAVPAARRRCGDEAHPSRGDLLNAQFQMETEASFFDKTA